MSSLRLADGGMVRYDEGERSAAFRIGSALEGYHMVAAQADEADGRLTVRQEVTNGAQRAVLCDTLTLTDDGLLWETCIDADRRDWNAVLRTTLQLCTAPAYRFWAPWANGRGRCAKGTMVAANAAAEAVSVQGPGWSDPLAAYAMEDARWVYGAAVYTEEDPQIGYCPFHDNVVCMPLYSVFWGDTGLSVMQSLEDVMLDAALETTAGGAVSYVRYHHRFQQQTRFQARIKLHAPDWRCGLGWFCAVNRAYVEPVDPLAYEVSGGGAYSSSDTVGDVETLKAMGFRVNWKASFDFPYMGMFLPPVGDAVEWTDYKRERTSIQRMRRYFTAMKRDGLYGLNYFNVTEFGSDIVYPFPQTETAAGERWQSAHAMLREELAGAVLLAPCDAYTADGGQATRRDQPYGTWGGAVVMDPGEQRYQEFLLEQARAHVRAFADSYGICIDRLDWLRLYNHRRDDGVSLVGGEPVASLYRSWAQLMERLGPVFHDRRQLIYCNNHVKRIDLLKAIDGVFDEFTYAATSLNLTGLLCLCMPAIGWVGDKAQLLQDGPDVFLQRYLYMGVHPVVPIAGNDHAIAPDAQVERLYLDYGPLFNRLRGRRWVLTPECLRVERALGNVFALPDGSYLVPVVLGEETAQVTLCQLPLQGRTWRVLYPGAPDAPDAQAARPVTAAVFHETIALERGCAVLLFEPAAQR